MYWQSQAQECVYELKMFGGVKADMVSQVRIAQEAACVSVSFNTFKFVEDRYPLNYPTI